MTVTDEMVEIAAKALWEKKDRSNGGSLSWEHVKAISSETEFPGIYWSILDAREEARTALEAVFGRAAEIRDRRGERG